MKKIHIRLLGLLSIFFLLSLSIHPVLAKEEFDIDVFNVDIIVNEDGSIRVTEELHVDFDGLMHGIYANVSSWYKMNWNINGENINRLYYFPVDNVHVLSSQPAEISHGLSGVKIKMGDPDKYAKDGEIYRYSYSLHTKDLNLDGLQMLYLNIISNGWDTLIGKVNFKITMPKSFDKQKIQFSTGSKENGNAVEVSWSAYDNEIVGHTSDYLLPKEGITIALPLEGGYFTFPQTTDFSLYILGGSLLLLLVTLFIYFRYGHDDKIIKTVEFNAPEGVSSAEVGYIIDGNVDNRDIISLILDWGNRGYLRIEDDEKTLTLSKIKDLPPEAPHYERTLFKGLFNEKEVITTKELESKFYTHIQEAFKNITTFFSTKKHRIYTSTSIGLRAIYMLISALPISLLSSSAVYFNMHSLLAALICFTIIELLACIAIGLFRLIKSHYYVYSVSTKIALGGTAFLILALGLAGGILICSFFSINLLYSIIGSLTTIMLSIFSVFMVKRTPYGVKMFGKILGLRDFILTAEKDRLAMLVQYDPYYFYSILPYAYALGLTDVWSKHFESLTVPSVDWYYAGGDFTSYMMIHHLTHSMTRMQTSMVSLPAPEVKTGGGSFGNSGGFGGSGFGGGGFGGSSGGGW